jgi:hypothetical protein
VNDSETYLELRNINYILIGSSCDKGEGVVRQSIAVYPIIYVKRYNYHNSGHYPSFYLLSGLQND